ncbi:hypothetical protein ACYSUO_40130 [Streptomyces sp. UC4497]
MPRGPHNGDFDDYWTFHAAREPQRLYPLHESSGPQEARRILRQRLDGIGARSVELLRAGAGLAAVVTAVGSRSSR